MIDLSSARTPPPMTPEILFLKGRLSLWQYSIPFFTANVPLKYAADNFKLFEDLPQADTGEWTLEELFQRDISWSRVEGDILQYLRNPSRPQFFNALTVALLPSGTVDFGQPHGEAVPLRRMDTPGLGEPLGVGGVQIQYFGPEKEVENGPGMIRWSTGHVDAVAVDGQHRLAAIKRFVQQTRQEVWKDASVPVIFVVADARVGFKTPHAAGEAMRTTGALRALFIDLNKNARSVSPTRNILLDDLDVVSVSTRSLVGGSLSVRAGDVDRIPLSLVDWLTDRNKIEDGPFLTTIMLLQEAVARLLAVPDPRLDEDDDSIEKVGAWLDRALPAADAADRETVMQQVRACAVQQSSLTWLPEHMAILRSSFEREWRPHLHALFRGFSPYRELWNYSEANDLLEPRFVNLYVAKEVMADAAGERRERRLVDAATADIPGWTLERRFERPLLHIEKEIKRQSWGYKVVFQRALLRAFVDLLRNPVQIVGAEMPRSELAAIFVRAMNRLVEVGAVDVNYSPKRAKLFWAGSGLTADGSIEFTNAGAERLRAWLLGFVVMCAPDVRTPTFGQLGNSDLAFLRRTFRTTGSPVYKGMAKLAAARGLDHEDEDIVSSLIRERYDHMRSLIGA